MYPKLSIHGTYIQFHHQANALNTRWICVCNIYVYQQHTFIYSCLFITNSWLFNFTSIVSISLWLAKLESLCFTSFIPSWMTIFSINEKLLIVLRDAFIFVCFVMADTTKFELVNSYPSVLYLVTHFLCFYYHCSASDWNLSTWWRGIERTL